MTQISLPSHILKPHLKSGKGTHFAIRVQLSCIGHLCLFSFFILDLDECKDKTHQCDVNANCTNIPGSYNCTCRPGYTGNGSICNGIISYPSLHFMFLQVYSYVFFVTEYFLLPPEIDECKDGSHDCHINANCTNIPGSYNCTCRPGYQGNGSICKGKTC